MTYTEEVHIPDPLAEASHQASCAKLFAEGLIWQLVNLAPPDEKAVEIMRDCEYAVEALLRAVEAIQPGKPADVDPSEWHGKQAKPTENQV